MISREGTEQGSPDQAFPKWKSIGIVDWDWRQLRRDADRPLRLRASRNRRTATRWTSASTPTSSCAGSAELRRQFRLRARRQQSVRHQGRRAASPATSTISTRRPTTCPGRYFYARATREDVRRLSGDRRTGEGGRASGRPPFRLSPNGGLNLAALCPDVGAHQPARIRISPWTIKTSSPASFPSSSSSRTGASAASTSIRGCCASGSSSSPARSRTIWPR